MTKQNIEYWVIPPECDAEFVAHMENVLETYEKPYDSSRPVVCMDEQPVQLVNETRQVIPATKTIPGVLTTNTNATAPRLFSCSANRLPAGGARLLESVAPSSTGLTKSRHCSMEDTPAAIASLWFATISTRTRWARSTKLSNRNERANTFAALTLFSRPNMAAGLTLPKTN